MLSLQGFVRCMEDADPTRMQGYKSTHRGWQLRYFLFCKSAVGFLPSCQCSGLEEKHPQAHGKSSKEALPLWGICQVWGQRGISGVALENVLT